jgi:FkbM family methyltransferase
MLALLLLTPLLAQTPPARPGKPGASPPAHRNILATEKKLYSQSDEELIIRDFFQDRRGGFFLDVGCARPITNSNTYYLEKHLGWSGIGVDGLPEYAKKWRNLRPRSRFFNYLVTDRVADALPFYRSSLPGISAPQPLRAPSGQLVPTEEIQVPGITLDRLLDDNGVTRIDFLSMDIEGFEPPALAGFDIRRFHPELACIEVKAPTRAAILAYFRKNGYRQIERYLERDQVNYYFTPAATR